MLRRRPVGLMDKASAPGVGDSRFESWAGHFSCCWRARATYHTRTHVPFNSSVPVAGRRAARSTVSQPCGLLFVFGCQRPRGVTVSTLDPESSDRGSNPCEAFLQEHARTGAVRTKGVKTLTHACVPWVRRCPLGSRSLFSGVALAAVGSGLRALAPGGSTSSGVGSA